MADIAYIFYQDQYIEWNVHLERPTTDPQPISVGFPGCPFPRIDAVLRINSVAYIFFEGQYCMYDLDRKAIFEGAPAGGAPIEQAFPGFPFPRVCALRYLGTMAHFLGEDKYWKWDVAENCFAAGNNPAGKPIRNPGGYSGYFGLGGEEAVDGFLQVDPVSYLFMGDKCAVGEDNISTMEWTLTPDTPAEGRPIKELFPAMPFPKVDAILNVPQKAVPNATVVKVRAQAIHGYSSTC